ncbi:MAG TPA: nuclear transport factor 2 family protein [Candidatus Acidoferrales bacterium]|nr:nuclear transport factor 2 family protein [Candidatus Acidoferrales bacterium]
MAGIEPTEVVLAFMERINAADVEGICALMTEDHLFVDALGARVEGREKMRQAWTAYFSWIPDYKVSHEEILPKGNLVAVFGTARGTYAADGKLRKENQWEIPAAWLAVVREGLVAQWRVYADNQPVRKLMGDSTP